MRLGLAIDGGTPVREALLPYGTQEITSADLKAVEEALLSGWLTTGPRVDAFEKALAKVTGSKHAVVVSSGTAALHAAMFALGIGPGDEVIVPCMSFAASANCIVFQGGTPVFVDVDPVHLLVDPKKVEEAITSATKAIIAVDYAGLPCDYDALQSIADSHGIALVSDACHSIGGIYRGRPVGSLARLTTFSFHPVKHIAMGEGGAVTTDDEDLAKQMRIFRNHGITSDFRQRAELGAYKYDMVSLGYNYRCTDMQCTLGLSQLERLDASVKRRNILAKAYDDTLSAAKVLSPLSPPVESERLLHAYHLYVIRLQLDRLKVDRTVFFAAMRAEGIGVNVHYLPIHLHSFYRKNFNTSEGLCPIAEKAYNQLLTLPMFPSMTDKDHQDVLQAVEKVAEAYRK